LVPDEGGTKVSLHAKVVLVTGAGAGIGEAAALEYGRRGAHVVVTDIDLEAATRTFEAIRADGGTAVARRMDLRVRREVSDAVNGAVEEFGQLDILANVGAVYPQCRIAEMTDEFWDNVFAVDLKGPLFACQAALPHLQKSRGVIVNVASGAAFYPIVGLAAYSAAKAGLVALGRSLALEADGAVRVNTVVPGPTRTQGAPGNIPVPLLGRSLDPKEIADVIVWLSSDAAGAVNGALFRVDGGHVMI
jgi:NAD(P)-dependent dehydrogenase (short-subunit alcohol dehydrogenase family)